MSCRGKTLDALGECDYGFKPDDFLPLLGHERDWFQAARHTSVPARRGRRELPERSNHLRN